MCRVEAFLVEGFRVWGFLVKRFRLCLDRTVLGMAHTHRPLSSSFLWFIFRIL